MPTPVENIQKVKEYYDTCTKWYRWFYYDKESLALHYGFWKHPKESRTEALKNQYREMTNLLKPRSGEVILDAGCGVGGASLWLAENSPANYVGITISETQLKMAKKYAKKRGKNRVVFYLKNYFDTGFENEKFDKIFAIESFCYAYPQPKSLYKEMFRILKPGGILVISDGVLLRKPTNQNEQRLAEQFCVGFKMAGWNTPQEIIAALKEVGFKDVHTNDKTKEIGKSVIDIHHRSQLVPLLKLLQYLRLTTKTEAENLLATKNQKELYDLDLFGYHIFVAKKLAK